jgi:hypothetical protein
MRKAQYGTFNVAQSIPRHEADIKLCMVRLYMHNVSFLTNSAPYHGAAMSLYNSSVTMTQCNLSSNFASLGAAIYLEVSCEY